MSSCRHLKLLATNLEENAVVYSSPMLLTIEPQPQGTGLLEAVMPPVSTCQESEGVEGL